MWLPYPGLIAAAGANAALGLTLLGHNGNNSNSTNRATSAITVSAGDRILAVGFGRETDNTNPAPTLSMGMAGFGGTWSWNTENVPGSVSPRHTLLAATAIVPADITTNTATPTLASSEQCNRWGWAYFRLGGIVTPTILKKNTATGTGNITPTLASAAGANAMQIAICCSVGLASAGTVEAGWTKLSDSTDYAVAVLSWLVVAARIGGGDDSCAFTALGNTQNLGLIFELAA